MKKILVSECLYGEKIVRYDACEASENAPVFLRWKEEGRLIPVCPEVFGGLPVPRPPSERVADKVMTIEGKDVTAEYVKGAEEALRLAEKYDIAFAIMKQNSPACGSRYVYDGTFTGTKKEGQGKAAEYLTSAGFKVFAEDELDRAAALLEQMEQNSSTNRRAGD
jgi:uncharacterized protein YbbK (DUF523 family)